MLINFIQQSLIENDLSSQVSVHEFTNGSNKQGKTSFKFTNKENGKLIGIVDFNTDVRFVYDELHNMIKFVKDRLKQV